MFRKLFLILMTSSILVHTYLKYYNQIINHSDAPHEMPQWKVAAGWLTGEHYA
jgi:hypothetical protein